jgi:hypothetical protein
MHIDPAQSRQQSAETSVGACQREIAEQRLEYSSGTRLNPYLMPKDCGFQRPEPEWLSTDVGPLRKEALLKRSNIIGQVAGP